MDVVSNVRRHLASWTKGGESECRNSLFAPHCNPSDANCVDTLTTAYHTLLCSALQTWSPKHPITPVAFVEFVQSVLATLPSSSSGSAKSSTNRMAFGEILVDMMWSVDTALDEVLSDAKITLAACVKQETKNNVSPVMMKAKKVEQTVEKDKETIQVIVKKFLDLGTVVNPHLCRERLDTAVLASVGLIPDKVAMDKKEIRTRTGLFYKQNKFNLLREQSEGYSKLTSELTSNLGPSHSPVTGRPTEPYSAIEERARPVWEKVISLIGYFDLDPNRALDIILDVLSVHLSTHYTFFVALLSFSPWAGSYRRPNPASMETSLPPGSFQGRTLDEILALADPNMREAANITSDGKARVLAQVLGFKFAYYQSADVNESTPKNLYLTAAILIREGFITLEDLYPHLSPDDNAMESVKEEYQRDVATRIAATAVSQLAMAAPLESSGSTKSKSTPQAEVKKIPEPKDVNQKVGLLTALLAVGALKPALAILSKFPFLVDARVEIADLVIRIMKVSISPLYESLLVTKERNPSFTQPRARYGTSGVSAAPGRKPVLTLWAPTPPSTYNTDFVFFYPDWVDQVPICSSLSDLEDVIEPLMKFIGVHVSRDPLFLTKFLRLGRTHLQTTTPIDPVTKKPTGEPDPNHPIRFFWFKVLRVYLLRALTLIRGNAVCTVEVWNIIRQYSTTCRWRLYGEWKTKMYDSHPELQVRYSQAKSETKAILRRLNTNSNDTLSGTVAKLAHSNPCVFFDRAVHQIMSYDNLANVVIQALRYVTNMGFDVLVYIIVDAFSDPRKPRLKDDGVNTADWLQSLASFTGMLFRRYSADLTPVLTYVMHQLYNGQTTELVVLKELIWKMAGIEPLPSLSDAQVTAMAGGPILRIESIASATRGARLDPGDAVLKGPWRLGKALLDSSLALSLLIQVAQQRQACVFKAPDTHLKSLASLYDTTHGVLLQYLDLLTSPSVIPLSEYANRVLPSLGDLGVVYGICAPICMQIIRPVLQASLLKSALAMQEQERKASEEAEKRLKAALTAKREPVTFRVASPSLGTSSVYETPTEVKPPTEEQLPQEDVLPDAESATPAPPAESPWITELAALFDDIKKIAPGNAYDIMGPGFYLTFWQLSTYDLSPPTSKYDEESAVLLQLSRQEESKWRSADHSSDRAKRSTAISHKQRRERYIKTHELLLEELKNQTASRAFTLKRLSREKQHWFSHAPKAGALVGSIIEHCIQPRCLLSPMDADFCAQFIKVLHTQGTPGFHTLNCYDKLLGDHVKVVLFSCSEYEAHNYGRFLLGILADMFKWYSDEAAYMADNRTKIGGKTVYNPGLQRTWSNKSVTLDSLLDWPSFQRILRKWHKKLAKCFIDCIQTGEFMHVYNTIIILKELLPVFPLAAVSITDTGASLDAAMDRFLESEDRGDLKILGRAYSAALKKRESLWAMPRKPPPANVATSSPKPSTSSQQNEKARSLVPPSGPSSTLVPVGDGRRNNTTPAPNAVPSGPRAQLSNGTATAAEKSSGSSISSAKAAMDSIPRPEVVKRVRQGDKHSQSPKPPELSVTMGDGVRSSVPSHLSELRVSGKDDSPSRSRYNSPSHLRDSPLPQQISSTDNAPAMPPPSVPSQTLSAQELRETAKQSVRTDKLDAVRGVGSSGAPSPRVRSPSPTSRPGTRNHSSESRASGGRSRSERGNFEGDRDERRLERESRQDLREHATGPSRRDSVTHIRSERSGRERISAREMDKDGDRDKERDRPRDRHDRDKDRERDRDSDRRDRERERDRDRDRDRDRHRRDDKDRDRDRDRESRKDRDLIRGQGNMSMPSSDDRALPTRPDPRHRPPVLDDSLGKRRRPADDDPDRGSKRTSRKDGHREDRGRRPLDKDNHDRNRDSDRRRRDREGSGDNDTRVPPVSLDKATDKRMTSESHTPTNPPGPNSKAQPPSAPRAMYHDPPTRGPKADLPSSRDRHRDYPTNPPVQGTHPEQGPPLSLGSLHSRIGDKEPPRSLPQLPPNSYRPESQPQRKDDDRETRKRTASDRDKEISEPVPSPTGELVQAPKRPRINRTRYAGGSTPGVAKKLGLPVDPSAVDKSQRRRD